MAKALSPWCKQVKKTMIDRDMSVNELSKLIGRTREYTSAVINGRAYSEEMVKAISDELNIVETACSLNGN